MSDRGRRASRAACWVGLALLGAARPGPGAEDPRAVEEAIQRGARWLLEDTRAARAVRGRLPGGASESMGDLPLRVLALLRSGVAPQDLAAELRALEALPLPQHGVYEVSLFVLALEARGVERIPPGSGEVHPTYRPHPPEPETLAHMARATRWLLERERDGTWGYGVPQEAHWDHSNTQFAVYALHAASVHGVGVPLLVFQRILRHHLQTIRPLPLLDPRLLSAPRAPELLALEDVTRCEVLLGPGSPLATPGEPRPPRPDAPAGGDARMRERGGSGTSARPLRPGESRARWTARPRGWGYQTVAPSYAMTAAGLSSLAMSAERLSALAPREVGAWEDEVRAALRDGAAGTIWQQRQQLHTHSLAEAPGYDLLSLEKGLDSVGLEEVAGRSWWREEARRVLGRQAPDGSWPGGYGHAINTAFVLLFLNRGTLSPFAREDRMGPVAAARPRTGAEPGRPRTGDAPPRPLATPASPAPAAAPAPPPPVAAQPVLPAGAVVLASGDAAHPDQLLAAARTTRGREGDRVLQDLQEAWAALPATERLAAAQALHELAEGAARDTTRSWARRALRELLEGDDPNRLEATRLLLGELARLGQAPDPGAELEREQARASLITALEEPRLPRALRRAILAGLVRQGERAALPWLLSELARRDAADRRVAWDLLVALVGEVRPFEPDGLSARREQALRAWRAWYEGPEGSAVREGPR